MNERQQALKRLSEIRTAIDNLNIESRAIKAKFEPFTAEERQAESDRIERIFDANCYYYALGDGCALNCQEKMACFLTGESAQAFKAKYPEFTTHHHNINQAQLNDYKALAQEKANRNRCKCQVYMTQSGALWVRFDPEPLKQINGESVACIFIATPENT